MDNLLMSFDSPPFRGDVARSGPALFTVRVIFLGLVPGPNFAFFVRTFPGLWISNFEPFAPRPF